MEFGAGGDRKTTAALLAAPAAASTCRLLRDAGFAAVRARNFCIRPSQRDRQCFDVYGRGCQHRVRHTITLADNYAHFALRIAQLMAARHKHTLHLALSSEVPPFCGGVGFVVLGCGCVRILWPSYD